MDFSRHALHVWVILSKSYNVIRYAQSKMFVSKISFRRQLPTYVGLYGRVRHLVCHVGNTVVQHLWKSFSKSRRFWKPAFSTCWTQVSKLKCFANRRPHDNPTLVCALPYIWNSVSAWKPNARFHFTHHLETGVCIKVDASFQIHPDEETGVHIEVDARF